MGKTIKNIKGEGIFKEILIVFRSVMEGNSASKSIFRSNL